MSYNDYVFACTSRGIDPAIAWENQNVKQAIVDNSEYELGKVLDTEF